MKASEARDLANKLSAHDRRILEKVYSQVKEHAKDGKYEFIFDWCALSWEVQRQLLYDGYQLEAIDRIGYRISWYNR